MSLMENIELCHNPDAFRYEAWDGSSLARQIDYRVERNVITVPHTGTPPQYRRQGLADKLTEFMMHDIQKNNMRVKPLCPYTSSWLSNHPEYGSLAI